MGNLFNLEEHPQIIETLKEALTKLIDQTELVDYRNPLLECEIKVDDGRIFKLVFERVDLD